ncbi:hypothetical protein QQY79_01445 [Flavobacterium tructae]|uniref:hypothetical protein n=1 Tax=Flavobacterium tructae TaxID=1114873 RepID=UPI002551EFFF|nr:hypothetical protein [Flavobacterium tructae]MDL2141169.1 hypothetical protein [Flavobacterium tructae]
MTIEIFRDFIEKNFRLEIVSENSTEIIYNYLNYKIELSIINFNDLRDKLSHEFKKNDTELYNDNYYEVLSNESNRIFIGRNGISTITDNVNNLIYEYNSPSDLYVLYVIDYIINNLPNLRVSRYFDILRFKRIRSFKHNEQQLEIFNTSIFEFLKDSLRGFKSIKINSAKGLTKHYFEQYSYSYIFSLSYNLSYTIYPLRYFDEYFSPLKVESIIRNTSETIDSPKRIYINDLILHYQKALSSESLDNQYLSFYHIIEYFFEKIYTEDLQNKVRNELTKPGFSYKKKTDIESLIKIIQNRTKIQKEEFQINELEALELTLRKYINDFNELRDELNSISANLSNYFKSNEVPFSNGNKVNFDLVNEEIYKPLAKRIYFTRSSIVHSKETDKSKYIPFKNDKELLPEIYLMRILTEKIIIQNSKEI